MPRTYFYPLIESDPLPDLLAPPPFLPLADEEEPLPFGGLAGSSCDGFIPVLEGVVVI